MLEISKFTVVTALLLFHVILAHLINWAVRESPNDARTPITLLYLLIIVISIGYLYTII